MVGGDAPEHLEARSQWTPFDFIVDRLAGRVGLSARLRASRRIWNFLECHFFLLTSPRQGSRFFSPFFTLYNNSYPKSCQAVFERLFCLT